MCVINLNAIIITYIYTFQQNSMNKYQTTKSCQSNSSLVTFIVISILLLDKTIYIYKTGFLAGFLFFIGLILFFQINKSKIPSYFIQ